MDVIVYRARTIDDVVTRELERLRREAPDRDIYVVGYAEHGSGYLHTESFDVLETTRETLQRLPYPGILNFINWKRTTGHNDLPVLEFFLANGGYEHYWVIEDDVRYTGKWGELFASLDGSEADLLVTTLLPKSDSEGWYWWPTVKAPDGGPVEERHLHRCFAPFARASRRFLRVLHEHYARGWMGHYEALWPTICSLAGLPMEDVGGWGPYVPEDRLGKNYTNDPQHWSLYPGTFVFRPSFHDRDILQYGKDLTGFDCLWHPVKWSYPPGAAQK